MISAMLTAAEAAYASDRGKVMRWLYATLALALMLVAAFVASRQLAKVRALELQLKKARAAQDAVPSTPDVPTHTDKTVQDLQTRVEEASDAYKHTKDAINDVRNWRDLRREYDKL